MLAAGDGRPLVDLIREAVDEYLDRAAPDSEPALASTYGAAPDFAVPPRDEWGEREARTRRG